jgi:phosphoglycerate dehydrogenase-like enzyme
MYKVLIHHELPIDELLRGRRDDLVVEIERDADEVVSKLAEADSFVTSDKQWTDEFLTGLSPGDWIQSTSMGYSNYPIEEFRERGIRFTNAAGLHAASVADHVFALALAFSRDIPK